MTVSKLTLYNGALRAVPERMLASLSENREPRRMLDAAWDGGAVSYCLEAGLWNFAMRTIKVEYSPSVEPTFGYPRAFDKPEDFVRVNAVCSDEYFKVPLLEYTDEANFWFADLEVLYVQYVSDDSAYGNDMSLWPQSFVTFVELHLASKIAKGLKGQASEDDMVKQRDKALKLALAKDAMALPTKFMPEGNWSRARRGGSSNRDGGSRNSF